MTEPHDERMRAFIVELVDDPPPAPPFPGDQEAKPVALRSNLARKGPLVGLAALAITLIAGLVSLISSPAAETGPAQPPETAEQAVDLLVDHINAGGLPRSQGVLAPNARCRIMDVTGSIDQDCRDLFGFLTVTNTEMSFGGCTPVGDGTLANGLQVASHSCLISFRTDIHSALAIPGDETVSMNPTVHFANDLIQELWIALPFTGNLALDDELWSYLLSVEADYVTNEGIPLFSPDMAAEFEADAANFASQNPEQ